MEETFWAHPASQKGPEYLSNETSFFGALWKKCFGHTPQAKKALNIYGGGVVALFPCGPWKTTHYHQTFVADGAVCTEENMREALSKTLPDLKAAFVARTAARAA